MANVTTCTNCGVIYEAGSEEQANERERLCSRCRPQPGQSEPEKPLLPSFSKRKRKVILPR